MGSQPVEAWLDIMKRKQPLRVSLDHERTRLAVDTPKPRSHLGKHDSPRFQNGTFQSSRPAGSNPRLGAASHPSQGSKGATASNSVIEICVPLCRRERVQYASRIRGGSIS